MCEERRHVRDAAPYEILCVHKSQVNDEQKTKNKGTYNANQHNPKYRRAGNKPGNGGTIAFSTATASGATD